MFIVLVSCKYTFITSSYEFSIIELSSICMYMNICYRGFIKHDDRVAWMNDYRLWNQLGLGSTWCKIYHGKMRYKPRNELIRAKTNDMKIKSLFWNHDNQRDWDRSEFIMLKLEPQAVMFDVFVLIRKMIKTDIERKKSQNRHV